MDKKHRQHMQDADNLIKSIDLFHNASPEDNVPSSPTPPKPQTSPIKLDFTNSTFWPEKVLVAREEIIVFIETFYMAVGVLPILSDFKARFSQDLLPTTDQEWQELFLDIKDPLEARGIPPYQTPIEYLEPNFVLAVTLILNAQDKRSISAKLKDAGLTTRQWTALLKKKSHMEYYRKLVEDAFDVPTQLESKVSLRTLIANGDLQAIKYYNELQSIYRPQQTNADLVQVLHKVMEILARVVTPEQLSQVAAEFQQAQILRGAINAELHSSSEVGMDRPSS